MKMARSETVSERLSHCNGCEHNKLGICKRCGCIIQGKTRLAGSFCPIGLWGKEEAEVNPRDLGIRSLFRQ
jgi:hypothetical protein